ncbi:MAG: hypothetical protein WAO20_08930 [Acidobacteriota bacterium]
MNEKGPDSTTSAGTTKLEKWSESVDSELYDELLNRYERVLVFAGQLQEKLKNQRLLAEKNEGLEEENQRLRRVVSAGEAYMKVLERALDAVGLTDSSGTSGEDPGQRR